MKKILWFLFGIFFTIFCVAIVLLTVSVMAILKFPSKGPYGGTNPVQLNISLILLMLSFVIPILMLIFLVIRNWKLNRVFSIGLIVSLLLLLLWGKLFFTIGRSACGPYYFQWSDIAFICLASLVLGVLLIYKVRYTKK